MLKVLISRRDKPILSIVKVNISTGSSEDRDELGMSCQGCNVQWWPAPKSDTDHQPRVLAETCFQNTDTALRLQQESEES